MAIREILVYPQHKIELRRKCDPVKGGKRSVRRIIRDSKDTLQASSDGIGLAAPQVDIHQRVIVVCLGTEVDGEW